MYLSRQLIFLSKAKNLSFWRPLLSDSCTADRNSSLQRTCWKNRDSRKIRSKSSERVTVAPLPVDLKKKVCFLGFSSRKPNWKHVRLFSMPSIFQHQDAPHKKDKFYSSLQTGFKWCFPENQIFGEFPSSSCSCSLISCISMHDFNTDTLLRLDWVTDHCHDQAFRTVLQICLWRTVTEPCKIEIF